MKRVLVTGAAGRIGQRISGELIHAGFSLRLTDIKPFDNPTNSEVVLADLRDPDKAKAVVAGMDSIIHLAGQPDEASFDEILQANIIPTYQLFEAARQANVPKIIFASSNRVTSFYPCEQPVSTECLARPDSLYAVSKGYGEVLARLYVDKYRMSIACLRIGSFSEEPTEKRHLKTWISPRDMSQLLTCVLEAPKFDYLLLYGVSNNTQNPWLNPEAEKIGYQPQDNAEDFKDRLPENTPEEELYYGGKFCID